MECSLVSKAPLCECLARSVLPWLVVCAEPCAVCFCSLPDADIPCQADEGVLVPEPLGQADSPAHQKDFDQN